MIKEIKEQFTENILEQAAALFGLPKDSLNSLGGFESYVYQYQKEGQDYILKITHSLRRTKDYILGEIDWLTFLAAKGLSVSKAIPSPNGNLIETIPGSHGDFLVISYEKAPGQEAHEGNWDETLFEKWGEFMGEIHKATKDYTLKNHEYKRQEWIDEEQLKAHIYVKAGDPVIPAVENMIRELSDIPKTPNTYGLVHADFHQKNFHYEVGRLYLFDFDDCTYMHFINDLGITFYYSLFYPYKKFTDQNNYAKSFFQAFMKGYLKHNVLPEDQIQYLEKFIKLRHAMLYIIFHQTHDVALLDETGQSLLEQHRNEILSQAPLFKVDFSLEYHYLLSQLHNYIN